MKDNFNLGIVKNVFSKLLANDLESVEAKPIKKLPPKHWCVKLDRFDPWNKTFRKTTDWFDDEETAKKYADGMERMNGEETWEHSFLNGEITYIEQIKNIEIFYDEDGYEEIEGIKFS